MPATDLNRFREKLFQWYRRNGRVLPWRQTTDPYAIWVSEVMLQQTQVATVLPYYERWMKRFPTLRSLAESDEQDALSLWQGLGYYRRCRLLLEGTRQVLLSGLPVSARAWQKVPGVGRYTSAAIASLTLGEPVAVVDGNVERFFARFNACQESGPNLHRSAWRWAQEVLDPVEPGAWNQATMELGATICTPKSPKCEKCPVSDHCQALAQQIVNEIPVRISPKAKREVSVPVFVSYFRGEMGLKKLVQSNWWEGLWVFPSEPPTEIALSTIPLKQFDHTVTSNRLRFEPTLCIVGIKSGDLQWYELDGLESLPMPAPFRRILRDAVQSISAQEQSFLAERNSPLRSA